MYYFAYHSLRSLVCNTDILTDYALIAFLCQSICAEDNLSIGQLVEWPMQQLVKLVYPAATHDGKFGCSFQLSHLSSRHFGSLVVYRPSNIIGYMAFSDLSCATI